LAVALGRLDRALGIEYRAACNRRLAGHLRRERCAIFTFLRCHGLEATNGRAEQAIRPTVVARKVWGGNRTATGARTQSVPLSLIQTCRQQQRPSAPLFQRLLCAPRPATLHLAERLAYISLKRRDSPRSTRPAPPTPS